MSLVRSKNVDSMIDMSNVEFAQVTKFNDEWVVEVHLKHRESPYLFVRNKDESFVRSEFERFMSLIANVETY